MLFIVELVINIIYFILSLFIPGKIKRISKEASRKMSHILCGNWIFIYAFINRFFVANVLILIFMIILMAISYKYNIFKGVERDNQDKSYGTVYFFTALLIFIVYIKIYALNSKTYLIYILPLVYGDAFAAIVGKKMNWIEYKIFNNRKSVSGNITMCIVSFLVIYLYNLLVLDNNYTILFLLLTSIIASIMEAISIKGTDNFTIPIFTMIIMEAIV